MKDIIKTFQVRLDLEPILKALMANIFFKEVDRIATGGMMSDPMLLISYAGGAENYREDGYVEVPDRDTGYSYFYSLKMIYGHRCKTEEEFFVYLKQFTNPEIIVKRIPVTE